MTIQKRAHQTLLALAATLVCFVAQAEPATDLSVKLKAIKTFSANFEQRLSDPSGEELQTTQGILTVKTPGLFYWQVSPPYEQVVVANKTHLWVYDPDLEQVTISNREALDNSPAQILSGDFSSLGEKYTVTNISENNVTRYTLKATDLTQSTFTTLSFNFTVGDVLAGMSLVDKLGQTTDVVFTKQQLNKDVADSLFNFNAPEGVDVITNE